MKSSLLLLFFFWFAAIQAQQGDYFVYISSLAPDNNAGIILLDFDSKTGQVQELKRFSDLPNTSYLNLSPDGKYLFTVYNNPDNQSALSSFSIRPEDGNLSLIDTRKNIGRGPCYVSVSTSGKAVLVANYVEGNVLSFQKKENGRIGKIISNIQHEFASKATERQEAPHPHMIFQSPFDHTVIVPDLGADRVYTYQINKKGGLSLLQNPFSETPPGSGPRHFVFHPNQKWGYVLNELNGTVTAFNYTSGQGFTSLISTEAGLPSDFTDFNKSADIHLTPDGKFLFTSNRGHNSITVFKTDPATGAPHFQGTFPCGGEWPRAFDVDTTGQFLLVANKRTDNLVVFRIDQTTGMGEKIAEIGNLGQPQCVKFLEK